MPGVILASSPPRAPVVVGSKTKTATRPDEPLPQYLIDEAKLTERVEFDASKHLNFEFPNKVTTMKELGLGGHGISPNAVSDPFQLFTQEAIEQIRAEVFSDEVMRDCRYTSGFCKQMVRGMGEE